MVLPSLVNFRGDAKERLSRSWGGSPNELYSVYVRKRKVQKRTTATKIARRNDILWSNDWKLLPKKGVRKGRKKRGGLEGRRKRGGSGSGT